MAQNEKYLRKPEWLKIKLNTNDNYTRLKKMMREKKLHTVCQEAKCPNIHECWAVRKTATFMILGDIFAETVKAIRRHNLFCTIEVLPSDMSGEMDSLKALMEATPDILNHNIETVRRLTPRVRARATYERSLEFLKRAKEINLNIPTKSSIMIGLGEMKEEILEAMTDLRAHDVDIFTLG